ncbi:putative transcription factor C2H2 family [Dioscorea sansibarensis]
MSCSSSDPPSHCSAASPELKLYQTFIFSVPVFFTFILLFLFYFFYLRRRRANWQSLRMRASYLSGGDAPRISESGIKKEVREMLPIVVFKESFLIRETQCSVCLGDYQSDERLQRIPHCGHTFHVDCIDHWLTTNTTCPLCRVSLLPENKTKTDLRNNEGQINATTETEEQSSERHINERVLQDNQVGDCGNPCSVSVRREVHGQRVDGERSVVIDVETSGAPEANQRV